eukprot:4536065-Karenia_brevis.AAC.1
MVMTTSMMMMMMMVMMMMTMIMDIHADARMVGGATPKDQEPPRASHLRPWQCDGAWLLMGVLAA